jgi:N-acetyl-gamma-glutamyl-phosphate reductase
MNPSTEPSVSAAVVGATGYGGAELVSILSSHPGISPDYLTSQSFTGKSIADVYPRFDGRIDRECESLQTDRLSDYDLVFFALPHGKSMEIVPELDLDETVVVDLAADYRLESPETFERVYETEHQDPDGLNRAVFGLTEYNSEAIEQARLVACPGCYVTASLIPLTPIMQLQPTPDTFFIDAKSGVSGAGRKPSTANTFVNCNDTIKPYKVATHRHAAEVEQQIRDFSEDTTFTFVPHVNAMDHGIEAAIYLDYEKSEQAESVVNHLRKEAAEHDLLRYHDDPKGVKPVVKTPFCDLTAISDGDRVIVFSYLDNLWKGAASQAVQNANLIFDYPETEGLIES